MVDALPGRVAQAEAAPLPHLEFLELLVEDELARRADRLFARRLKQAGITVVKTLADFDWTFNPKIPKAKIVELASARFVQTHDGVLLIGPPGVGKSHIATAIAVGAIRAGRRALVRSTFDLAADFAQADATGARRDFVQQLTRVDLLVLEDFGMKKLGSNAAEDLLEVFVRRHETASTLITTNRPTQDWGIFLGDVPAATAILDRFLAHATIVPDDRQELSTAPAGEYDRRLRPWTVPQPWTPRTRPPLLGKRADAFPTPPTAVLVLGQERRTTIPRLRAGTESDDTHATYRVAAFQTFLSGRI